MNKEIIESNKYLLITKILYVRKTAAEKISKKLKLLHDKNLEARIILLRNKIIKERYENSVKIQKATRNYLFNKEIGKSIKNYIDNIYRCFFFKSGISGNDGVIKMSIYYKKRKLIFDMNYDKFFNAYICFIERQSVEDKEWTAIFTKGNEVLMDPSLKTKVVKGKEYNVINFQDIRKAEMDKYEKRDKEEEQIFTHYGYDRNKYKSFNKPFYKTISNYEIRSSKKKSTIKMKKVSTVSKLFRPASILKPQRSFIKNDFSERKSITLLDKVEYGD